MGMHTVQGEGDYSHPEAKKHSPSRPGAVSRVWFLGEEPSGYSSSP